MNYLINHKKQIKKTRRAITLSLGIGMALGIPAFAEHANNHADLTCDVECESEVRGRIDDDSRLVNRSRKSNTERRMPNETITLHALPALEKVETMTATTTIEDKEVYSGDKDALRFRSGYAEIDSALPLDDLIVRLNDKKNVRLHVVGHADKQRLSIATKKRFANNQELSEARARNVARYLRDGLSLSKDVVGFEGKGDTQPLTTNPSKIAIAHDRRVEVQIWYDDEIKTIVPEQGPAMNRTLVCNDEIVATSAAGEDGFRISVDGVPVDEGVAMHDADTQRCTDIALEENLVQLQYDSNKMVKPFLNATADPATTTAGETVKFQGYSNYLGWIKRAEVRIFKTTDSRQSEPLAIVPLNDSLAGEWQANGNMPKNMQGKMHYRLRVYDENDRFDETSNLRLWLNDQHELIGDEVETDKELLAGYGENHLALYNINLQGGTMTVNGRNIPANHEVYFMGSKLPTDKNGKFVGQQIVPPGMHNVEVAVLDQSGNGQLFWRELKIEENNWFYVGIADFTVGRNYTSGPAALVTNDSQHFDDDIYADGRMAFYAKGKWRGKYTITTSADTFEQPIDDLFSNLDHKDPRSLLRRLDEEDHYPVYGDDSTIVDGAPTQGKFFAKIEDQKSHLMWGNFQTHITDTDFAHIERGLYGAQMLWNSEAITSQGERRTTITGFAAEPGTIASFEEFRGTGGSLYYLQHQDITRGSEQVRIEVRDKDSDIVLSVNHLAPGQDYDIDSIQGRVLLTHPLSSLANDNLLVRDGGLSGHPAYLVVNYEFTPGLSELDELAYGGRASHWFGDYVKLGMTASHQQQQGNDQDLQAVDLTLRKTPETYIKLEAARTEGPGIGGQSTNNGGFNFDGITQDRSNGVDAEGYRAEAAVKLSDVGVSGDGIVNIYTQNRKAGFSAPGQLTQYDTDQFGGALRTPLGEKTDLTLKFDSKDERGGIDTRAIEADVAHQISNHWTLSGGVRNDRRKQGTKTLIAGPFSNTDEGDRTDLTLQANYDSDNNWDGYGFVQGTVERDDTRRENNRYGVGGTTKISDRLDINGEISGGNGGLGAQVGSDYRLTDRSNVYLGYELDPDRTDNLFRGRNGQLTSGMKHRYSDALSVFGEGRYQHGDSTSGLTHAYGLDYAPTDTWTFGLNFETGELTQKIDDSRLDRTAVAATAGYHSDDVKYGVALEYRNDESNTDDRVSWLMRNNIGYQVDPDWRAQARLDFAFSDSNQANTFNSDYTEAILGFGYRPVNNDRFNALMKYTYLMDLAPFDQFTASGAQGQNQQRSHVVSLDAIYDLNERWTLGGKYAYRMGELRLGREEGDWFDSEAHLLIGRLDWHVVRQWDFMIEGRMLELTAAEDRRIGALTGLYRHFNENMKLGVGYNFTDFSDDLTDQDYDAHGWFLNAVGKF